MSIVDAHDRAHQDFESGWWGDCANTFGEEAKQVTYAHRMGLTNVSAGGHWPVYDAAGKAILDLGGGPVSMLLKTVNASRATVVDPCAYPDWIAARYAAHGVEYVQAPAEGWQPAAGVAYDECWIYNVLQHVVDPRAVIETALAHAAVVRIFDWVNVPASLGHPHVLSPADLDAWLGGQGTVADINENGAIGPAYWNVVRQGWHL